MIKVASSYFGTRSKVIKAKNTNIKTFDLVIMYHKSFDLVPKMTKIYKTFDLVPEHAFDLVPKITKKFDQVVRCNAIRLSDPHLIYESVIN